MQIKYMHAGPKGRGVGGGGVCMYVFDTAILLYILKPTIDLNGGGRQGNIVTHYVSTSCLCVWKIFHYLLQSP